jgi:hypothetical protein
VLVELGELADIVVVTHRSLPGIPDKRQRSSSTRTCTRRRSAVRGVRPHRGRPAGHGPSCTARRS